MSLDKAILHKKEFRKAYRKAKAVDKTCRNHGSCPFCRNRRLHNAIKTDAHSQYDMTHYENETADEL